MNQCQMHDYFTELELEQEDLELLADFDRPNRPQLVKRILALKQALGLAWSPDKRAELEAKIDILESELQELE